MRQVLFDHDYLPHSLALFLITIIDNRIVFPHSFRIVPYILLFLQIRYYNLVPTLNYVFWANIYSNYASTLHGASV